MQVLKYLDMSAWQTEVDYTIASKDLDGVILRAGFGKGTADQMFAKHYEGFRKAGIPIGVYWFSYAKTVEEAKNEAFYCVAAIHGLEIELPVIYDFEYASVENAKKAGVKVDKTLATAMADAFLSPIEANGYYAMLYTSPDFKRNYCADSLNRYDLWLANYVKNPDVTKPPQTCGMWQHGSGYWQGVKGEVDQDAVYKDYQSIIRNAGLNHLNDKPVDRAIEWACNSGLLLKNEVEVTATKGDIARMLYECYFRSQPEDSQRGSGLLGG